MQKNNKISGQLQHGTTLHVKIEVCVYERLMDGLVSTSRGVQGGVKREMCMSLGDTDGMM